MASRIGALKTGDSTGGGLVYKASAPAYTATLALTPDAYHTEYLVGQLTGAMTINITESEAKTNDKILFIFSADGTNRVVTFGTNLASSGTLTVTASKKASALFVYDGSDFVEVSRTVTA